MKILEILSHLGKDDEEASNQMYKVVEEAIKRAENAGNIGHALVYQCLITILKIHPNEQLLSHVSRSITWFFTSDSKNLNYIGITGLIELVKKDAKYAA